MKLINIYTVYSSFFVLLIEVVWEIVHFVKLSFDNWYIFYPWRVRYGRISQLLQLDWASLAVAKLKVEVEKLRHWISFLAVKSVKLMVQGTNPLVVYFGIDLYVYLSIFMFAAK